MPLTKSVIKRMKQSNVARVRNFSTKKAYKTVEKKLVQAIADKDSKSLPELLSSYFSKVDTAAKKNVIHKNKASRKKAQLAKKVSEASK